MGRYIRDFQTNANSEYIHTVLNQYLSKEGYKYITLDGENVFKMGVGVLASPTIFKFSYYNNVVRMETWMKYTLLPGVYIGEIGVDGFVGALAKGRWKKRIKYVEDLLLNMSKQFPVNGLGSNNEETDLLDDGDTQLLNEKNNLGFVHNQTQNSTSGVFFCEKCGAELSGNIAYCTMCGEKINNTDIKAISNTPSVIGRQAEINSNGGSTPSPVNGYNQFNQANSTGNSWHPPVSTKSPKKKHKVLIACIVVISFFVLSSLGVLAVYLLDSWHYEDTNDGFYDAGGVYDDFGETEYDSGFFDGAVYRNYWAGIEMECPEGFSQAPLDTYSSVENETTECGVYFVSDDSSSSIFICYEKLPDGYYGDEWDYLDAVISLFQDDEECVYYTPDSYTTEVIADRSFLKAECSVIYSRFEVFQTFYVRKVDDYMIVICAISDVETNNDGLVSGIYSVG